MISESIEYPFDLLNVSETEDECRRSFVVGEDESSSSMLLNASNSVPEMSSLFLIEFLVSSSTLKCFCCCCCCCCCCFFTTLSIVAEAPKSSCSFRFEFSNAIETA